MVIAPEKKRMKLEDHYAMILLCLHEHNIKKQIVATDFPEQWRVGYSLATQEMKNYLHKRYHLFRSSLRYLFVLPGTRHQPLQACLRTAEVFKVDQETSIIEENQIDAKLWPLVEEADHSEIRQFVEEKAFRKVHISAIETGSIMIDARWLRKWKRQNDKTLKVKSRLVARGCFDAQKEELTTRSTTATRLSQRLLVSTAAAENLCIESFDIAGAFLKGFTFEDIQRALRKKGITSPTRVVIIFPPANVWRHLGMCSADFKIEPHQVCSCGLLCVKPVYGLNDAPLAWQLSLHQHLQDLGGEPSLMDENQWRWYTKEEKMEDRRLEALLTTHVDDLAIAAKQPWLDNLYNNMVAKFKKVSRQQLPFEHCGCEYALLPDGGFSIKQTVFSKKIPKIDIPKGKKDEDRLTGEETTSLRSCLGALLWLAATRLDIVADVSYIQSKVTTATIKDLKIANQAVDKAKADPDIGLIYRPFKTKHRRLVLVHDASSASKGRQYAQEGILVMLADDQFAEKTLEAHHECDDRDVLHHGGVMHVLFSHGAKAKRVSYSTSHAETLSMVNGIEASTLVMVRLSEILHFHVSVTVNDLIKIQEENNRKMPVDSYGDCTDLWELITGLRSTPQDRTQRLYVLSIKEARISGGLRQIAIVPTECMTADALTKPMTSPCLLKLMSSGIAQFWNEDGHPVLSRTLPTLKDIEEEDLYKTDEEIFDKAKDKDVKMTMAIRLVGMAMTLAFQPCVMRSIMFLTLVQMAKAEEDERAEQQVPGVQHYFLLLLFVTITVGFFVNKAISAVMKTKHAEEELSDDGSQPMEVEQEEEFMEVDQSNMSQDDEDDAENETSQLRKALEEVRQEMVKMTVEAVNIENENKRLRKDLAEKEEMLEDCDGENRILRMDNLAMTDKMEEMKQRMAHQREVLDMYEGVREGEQQHYTNMLLESGRLAQKSMDDEKKIKELEEKCEKCREEMNRAIIARDRQNRELAALRIGVPSLVLTTADGLYHVEDCKELYRSPRLTPYQRCRKCFPNVGND